ncbi:MAG: hypothetical protein KBT35_07285 [Firmicutes bacterium]|nr:hypothetical protein [Candidatus Colivicinus equi]
MIDVKELKDEEIEKIASGTSRNEQIKFLKSKIERLEELLLVEDDPEEIAKIKEEIEMYKKILYDLMHNHK